MSKAREFGIAVLRTSIVPPVGGFISAFLLRHGITIDASWVFAATAFVFSGVYYCILHSLEVWGKNPTVKKWAGIFLGKAVEVSYAKRENPPT